MFSAHPAAASGVVLVVEDDFDVLNAASPTSSKTRVTRSCRAANGFEALVQLGDRKGHCDLILLDLPDAGDERLGFPPQAKADARIRRHSGGADVRGRSPGGGQRRSRRGWLPDEARGDDRPARCGQAALPVPPPVAHPTGSRRPPPPRRRPIGALGRYRLVKSLGVGGMAEAFKATCSGPGGFERTVVVKRILPGELRDSVSCGCSWPR